MTISVRPASAHTSGYVLLENGLPIGWLRYGAIGFGGFRTTAEASHAASRAVPELLAWYRTRWFGDPIPWVGPVEASGRVECDGMVVGRLVPTHDPSSLPSDGYGFELRIPTGLWVGTCEDLVRRLAHAMRAAAARATGGALGDDAGPSGDDPTTRTTAGAGSTDP